MRITLAAHPRTLAASLRCHADPLRILRLVNHVNHWSHCTIRVWKPAPRDTRLSFSFRAGSDGPGSPNIFDCADGSVPELFDCDELLLTTGTTTHTLSAPRTALDVSSSSFCIDLEPGFHDPTAGWHQVVLKNYHKPHLLPDLSSPEQIVERLRRDTLLGCGALSLGDRRVEVHSFADAPITVRRSGFNGDKHQSLSAATPSYRKKSQLSDTIGIDVLLWASPYGQRSTLAKLYSGQIPLSAPRQLTVLTDALRTSARSGTIKILSSSLEITIPSGQLDHDAEHRLIPTAQSDVVLQEVHSYLASIAASDALRDFLCRVSGIRESHAADRIHERRDALRARRRVFFSGRELLQEPTSENDVLGLYFKLEGANAIPFHTCQVLEHTPKRDTDAIGHFRIRARDVGSTYALIEFEHKFANFIEHGHSVAHVDLIICWSTSKTDGLTRTEKPWLQLYHVSNRTIPVLVLQHIPRLEVHDA